MSAPSSPAAIRILIIEDTPLYAMQLRLCLDELGYESVGPATNAEQGEALFLATTPDLVLLDIGLEGPVDGIELAQRLREHRPDMPLIFVTSYSDRTTFERARAVGPLAYVSKPFLVPTVQHAIELALQQTQHLVPPIPGAMPPPPPLTTDENWSEDVLVRDAFFVKNRDRLTKIHRSEVLAIEASEGYSLLRTDTGGKYLLSMSLGRLEEKLAGNGFLRTHRTWLINAERVDEILLDQNSVRLQTLLVPVSAGHRAELLRRLPLLS